MNQQQPDRPVQLELMLPAGAEDGVACSHSVANALKQELAAFNAFGTATEVRSLALAGHDEVPVFINEFWTAKQRAAHSLHEVSYRACFKPQLPRFFIERLTRPGDIIYDPFMGRGTTLLEAALLGRIPWGCDINPLSALLVAPRLNPPTGVEIAAALDSLPLESAMMAGPEELLAFYHPTVLKGLMSLKERFCASSEPADAWLRMVATNRLTGHSPGFSPFILCRQIRLFPCSRSFASMHSEARFRPGGT